MKPPNRNPLRHPIKLSRVLKIAHRGARAFAPENTLPSFEKAVRLGCDMFELDVHFSKDNKLVVHHDDQLTRCTDVRVKFPGRDTYYVSDFSWREIQTLDAGSWFDDELIKLPSQRQEFLRSLTSSEIKTFVSTKDRALYTSGTVRIPSLEQVLELAIRTEKMVNIEIKTLPRMYSGLTEAIVQLVKSLKSEHRVLISSFDHAQLLEVRRLSNVIPTAVLTCDRIGKPHEYLQNLDADAYNPGCYGDYDSLGFGSVTGRLDLTGITQVRAASGGVNVWTCNNPTQMRELVKAGVSGLITDFLNRVR